MLMLFKVLHLDRVADAILALQDQPERVKYLRELISGSINFFERRPSRAKDIFWELELWSRLRQKLTTVYLQEPPDIVMDFDGSTIGIACKKLYSEKHVQSVLSEAVAQIEDKFAFGVVAINLDDLAPADRVLKVSSENKMAETLQEFNADFIRRHDRHLRKYLSVGRIISALISTTVVVDIVNAKPQFNNTFQWMVWTIPGLADDKKRLLEKFYDAVINAT